MKTLLLALLASAGAAAAPVTQRSAPASQRAAQAAVELLRAPAMPHGMGDTRCGVCHSTESWKKVTFDHDHTGFPLQGRHAVAECSSCHTSGADFRAPVPTSCAACHRDVHAGEFGTRCASCHDAQSWRSRFEVDAHRRTNFPLSGRHATIPCESCHLDLRDRGFVRAAVACASCHQSDYVRAGVTSIDHVAAGFGTSCRDCHNPWSFRGARFVQHQACFQLAPGPHAGLSCLDCHTTLRGAVPSGTCSTNTASCTRCHQGPITQAQHRQVAGFQYKDRECFECSQFPGSVPRAPPPRGG